MQRVITYQLFPKPYRSIGGTIVSHPQNQDTLITRANGLTSEGTAAAAIAFALGKYDRYENDPYDKFDNHNRRPDFATGTWTAS